MILYWSNAVTFFTIRVYLFNRYALTSTFVLNSVETIFIYCFDVFHVFRNIYVDTSVK